MKNIYKIIVVSFILFMTIDAFAQQDPQYTQYMYNMNVVNPAYAGSRESLALGLLYRNQWTGIPGAPKTLTFSGHSPIGEKTGLGLSAIADKLGPVSETNIFADFSYTLNLGDVHKLAFGLKGGMTLYKADLVNVRTQTTQDAAFSQDIDNISPNVGLGLLYYTNDYYVGFSVPNLLKTIHLDYKGVAYGNEYAHFFLTGGYVYQMTPNIKFKPSALVKGAFNAPISFDINANFLFNEKFEGGISYRYEDSVSALVGVRPLDWINVGFAYDYTLSDLKKPSFEVFMAFDLFFTPKTYLSPRYF